MGSVSGSKKVIKCHKAILANSSPFLRDLLDQQPEAGEEPLSLHLSELSFPEAMAMLNLVYVGSVRLNLDQLDIAKQAAKKFLDISVEVEPVNQAAARKAAKKSATSMIEAKLSAKRPLRVKSAVNQNHPIFFVMPNLPPSPSIKLETRGTVLGESGDVIHRPQLESSDDSDALNLNSYQKAKIRCADKYKCNLCGKGFPLSCLLQRHKRTHSDIKPFPCSYCQKSFSSKTTLKHHNFMRHLEEQSKKIEEGKKLLETLRRNKNSEKLGVIDSGGGQVIKVMSDNPARGDFLLEGNPGQGDKQHMESVEIIGVQDITQQIAVQMCEQNPRETVIEMVDSRGNISVGQLVDQQKRQEEQFCPDSDGGLYYIEGVAPSNQYWEYKS